MTEWPEQPDVCEHVKRRVGAGEDHGVFVESWFCDTCELTLVTRRTVVIEVRRSSKAERPLRTP
jgi:hypothetical protein